MNTLPVQAMQAALPSIAWDHPVRISVGGLSGLCCRVCVCNGDEETPTTSFASLSAFEHHFEENHR